MIKDVYRRNAYKGIIFLVVLTLLAILPFLVEAAQCTSQSCATNTTVTVANSAPTVAGLTFGAFTGTGYTNISYYVLFNVTDANGVGNINYSQNAGAVAFMISNVSGQYNNASNAIITRNCTQSNLTTTISRFNCSLPIPYHFKSGTWFINASACDNSASCDQNSSGAANFTINSLDYVNSSNITLVWNAVGVTTTNNLANNTITFSNGGNNKYGSLNITAYNSTSGSNVIQAENYSASNSSAAVSEVQLSANTSKNITAFKFLDKCNTMCPVASETDSTENFFVDVGNLATGTYTSVADWALALYTG